MVPVFAFSVASTPQEVRRLGRQGLLHAGQPMFEEWTASQRVDIHMHNKNCKRDGVKVIRMKGDDLQKLTHEHGDLLAKLLAKDLSARVQRQND